MRITVLNILLLFTLMLTISCKNPRDRQKESIEDPSKEQKSDSSNVQAAITDLEIPFMDGEQPSQIIRRLIYTTSYNHETRCPNWVAWVLTDEMVKGEIEKKIWFDENRNAVGIPFFKSEYIKGTYIYDEEAEEPRPEFADWDLMPAGASHGHMCPAGDCKISKETMNQSFLLTNLCVQAEKLNTGSWNKLESSCREWALKYGRLFIVTGPIFNDGKVSQRMGNIAIPDGFFKVILCVDGTPKAVGFVYDNNNEKHSRDESICSVDDVEKLTGIDFFPQLPNEIEEAVESQANYNEW